MIKKEELQKLLQEALSTGADFAEIFIEDTKSSTIRVTSGEVTSVDRGNVYGAGVRLILGLDEVYGYTNLLTYESILGVVKNLRASFNGKLTPIVALRDKKPFVYNIKHPMDTVLVADKSAKLQKLSNQIKAYDKRIVQAITQLLETEQKVLVANSLGVYQDDIRTYSRVVLMAVASENGQMQEAFEGPGRYMGFEIFDECFYDFILCTSKPVDRLIRITNGHDVGMIENHFFKHFILQSIGVLKFINKDV
jgi:TldD protein